MRTEYNQGNQKFSDKAHEAARSLVYPQLFGCEENRLHFGRASVGKGGKQQVLDGEMAIDCIVKVNVDGHPFPLEHTIQERFRRPRYRGFRDVTITTVNNASGVKSELYKMSCGLFVYGYYSEDESSFGDVIVVDVPKLIFGITMGSINYRERNNVKGQDFIAIPFDELHEAGVVIKHFQELESQAALRYTPADYPKGKTTRH